MSKQRKKHTSRSRSELSPTTRVIKPDTNASVHMAIKRKWKRSKSTARKSSAMKYTLCGDTSAGEHHKGSRLEVSRPCNSNPRCRTEKSNIGAGCRKVTTFGGKHNVAGGHELTASSCGKALDGTGRKMKKRSN